MGVHQSQAILAPIWYNLLFSRVWEVEVKIVTDRFPDIVLTLPSSPLSRLIFVRSTSSLNRHYISFVYFSSKTLLSIQMQLRSWQFFVVPMKILFAAVLKELLARADFQLQVLHHFFHLHTSCNSASQRNSQKIWKESPGVLASTSCLASHLISKKCIFQSWRKTMTMKNRDEVFIGWKFLFDCCMNEGIQLRQRNWVNSWGTKDLLGHCLGFRS